MRPLAPSRDELRTWLLSPPGRGARVRNEQVLRMFLLSALDPADARAVLERIAAGTAHEAAELRQIRDEAGPVRPGPDGFGQLAAEYGLRQYEAVHGWALWALAQLDASETAAKTAEPAHP